MREIRTGTSDTTLPLSAAIQHGDTIYVSGQGPLDPETREVVGETAGEQTATTLENIDQILQAGGSSLADVVKANVYLTDMANYEEMNAVYEEYMNQPFPARTAVEVSDLPVDIEVEIEVVAAAPS